MNMYKKYVNACEKTKYELIGKKWLFMNMHESAWICMNMNKPQPMWMNVNAHERIGMNLNECE